MKRVPVILLILFGLVIFGVGYISGFREKVAISDVGYMVLEILDPQPSKRSTPFADQEEFATFIWHDSGHVYYIWSMYVTVFLDRLELEFQTVQEIEEYYHSEIIKLGWEETLAAECNSYMRELRFSSVEYQAFAYNDSKYYAKPIACLAVWPLFPEIDSNTVQVLLKTINPGYSVLSDWD